MPLYAYRGLDTDGRAVGGVVDADSARGARQKLRRTGVFPTALDEERRAPTRAVQLFAARADRVPAAELAAITRQFSTLVAAGLPLVEALEALSEQAERPALTRVLAQVRQEVTEGSSLADALAQHPRIFGSLYVNMVRAGEVSGALHIVLERLADYTENQARLLGKVRSALTYPAIMLLLSGVILFFLLSYVVPKVTRIFQETHQQLPAPTRVLLGVSDFVAEWWWLLLTLLAVGTVAARRWARTPSGRGRVDQWAPRRPLLRQADAEARGRPLRPDALDPAGERDRVAPGARHREEHR